MVEITGLIVSIALVLILLYLKKNLGLVMVAGSLVLALAEGVLNQEGLKIAGEAIFSPVTVNLLIAIVGMGILGEIMYHSGAMETSLNILKALVRDSRILIITLSSLIGLIAIPGGAYFSSPLVKEAGADIKISNVQMALTNVYFRHVFYAVFPLFTGFIAMVNLSNMAPLHIISLTAAPMLITLLFGFYLVFRKVEPGTKKEAPPREDFRENLKKILYGLSPLILTVVIFVVLGWPLWAGLFLGIVLACLQYLPQENREGEVRERLRCFYRGIPLRILTGVLGIMLFKEFIAQSQSLYMVSDYLEHIGMPVIVMVILLPFLSGLATGNCLAALGISFPVLYPMLDPAGSIYIMMAIIYLSSLWGYISSPVHLCLVLTVEYFEVSLTTVIVRLFYLSAAALGLSVLFLIALQMLSGGF